MSDEEFLDRVRRRMDERSMSQSALAASCSLSQPHLRTVLSGKVKLARKTKSSLRDWMEGRRVAGSVNGQDEWDALITRLRSRGGENEMQIMQLLRVLDDLLP